MTEAFLSVCMNWTAYDVPTLWAMLAPEQDGTNREQASAWLRTFEMLDAHHANLQTLRDEIAERWPPGSSGASVALLERLDALLTSTRASADAARRNTTALDLLTDALMEAKAKIQPLQAQWDTAPPGQRIALTTQARAIMSQADNRVIEHASLLTVPPGYEIPTVKWSSVTPDTPGASGDETSRTTISPLRGPAPAGGAPGPAVSVGPTARQSNPQSYSPDPILMGGPPQVESPPGSGFRAPTLPGTPQPEPMPVGQGQQPVPGILSPLSQPGFVGGRGTTLGGPTGMESERNGAMNPARGVIAGKSSLPVEMDVSPARSGEPMTGGLLGGGMVGGRSTTRTWQRQYSLDEEWDVPTGVDPVLKPAPKPDPKTAFDPGPNVIGLGR